MTILAAAVDLCSREPGLVSLSHESVTGLFFWDQFANFARHFAMSAAWGGLMTRASYGRIILDDAIQWLKTLATIVRLPGEYHSFLLP